MESPSPRYAVRARAAGRFHWCGTLRALAGSVTTATVRHGFGSLPVPGWAAASTRSVPLANEHRGPARLHSHPHAH